MKVSTKKNDGVSPVIGTILLVAITVVLVAIISAVVMGMTGNVGNTHVVGVTVGQDSAAGNITVTITGGADANQLSALYVYNGSSPVNGTVTTTPVVGVPYSFSPGAGQASISVVGTFSDGNQTIYTGTINVV